ncbi:MAG: dual specificity protein phosphatase family protein [Bacteroidota bacterium]|nr:dual specificity protein phosphatase family protein [Bacteroidota bacterium]
MYVIRPWLVLGKHQETHHLPLLQAYGIEAMLQFAEKVEHPTIRSLYLPIEDGIPLSTEAFQQGIDFMHTNHQEGKKILVSCGAGISRSVTFVIAFLKETEELTLLEAYQTVLKVHGRALPHPKLWQSLCAYYQENSPYWHLLKKYNGK